MKVELSTFARASLEALGFDFRESDHCISIGEGGVSAVFLKRRLNGYFEIVQRRHKSPGHWLRHEFGGDPMSAFVAMRDDCIILHSEWMLCKKEDAVRNYPWLTRNEYIDAVDAAYQDVGLGARWLWSDFRGAINQELSRFGLAAFQKMTGDDK